MDEQAVLRMSEAQAHLEIRGQHEGLGRPVPLLELRLQGFDAVDQEAPSPRQSAGQVLHETVSRLQVAALRITQEWNKTNA